MKRLPFPWFTLLMAFLCWCGGVALATLLIRLIGRPLSTTGFLVGVGCMSLGLAIGVYRSLRHPPVAGPFSRSR